MPLWCPKKESRIYPDVCKKLCPNLWVERVEMKSDGSLACTYKTLDDRRIDARYESKDEQV